MSSPVDRSHGASWKEDCSSSIADMAKPYRSFVVITSAAWRNCSQFPGGSIPASAELCDKIQPVAMLLGTPGDPFSSWLIHRGIHTASLRLPQAMHTAEKLAAALAKNPHVSHVNHPSLPDYPQKALADSMFGKKGYCAMLSFIVPEDLEKIDQFMLALRFPRYAPTLGGLHTTLSHPVTSSHMGVPDETRRKMGITPGMIRVSVGIEDADDLVADFENALKVFD